MRQGLSPLHGLFQGHSPGLNQVSSPWQVLGQGPGAAVLREEDPHSHKHPICREWQGIRARALLSLNICIHG